jgi:chromosome segregation ATPase
MTARCKATAEVRTVAPSTLLQCALSEESRVCYSYLVALTLEDLDRRVSALERAQGDTTESLRWVVAKLGRIQAIQDEHTLRLDRVEGRLEKVEGRLEKVEGRLDSVESKLDALPRAIAELVAASEKRLLAAIAER